MDYIAERDPKTGRILKAGPAVLEALALGRKFNWASPYRRMCAKCRRIAMRGSDFCWTHDINYMRNRLRRAIENNDPNRITQAFQRKHRNTMRVLWRRDPWFNAMTIWFAPEIEAEFRHACADAVLPLGTISPFSADTLRWQWRYSRFARDDWTAWERAIIRVREREHQIGPPPDDWVYLPPGTSIPNPPITVVRWRQQKLRRKPGAHQGWTPKMKAAARKGAEAEARAGAVEPVGRVEAFLAKHQRDLREVWQRLGDAADIQSVRNQVARAYAKVLRGEYEGHKALGRLMQRA